MNWNIIESHNYKHYMQQFSIHSLLAKVIDSKGFDEEDVQSLLSPRLIYHDFSLFLEGEMALERIKEAIEQNENICIYGDYDCDGILATAILVQAFSMLGKKVGYHIPHRRDDGYGLNKQKVQEIYDKGYKLIITVDNGIRSHEAIELANELGVDVIVSDHHDYDELPDAFAIIHPKMSPEYPFKEISGGFIAYKLASALLGKHDKYLYCLAAITTISDMMPLLAENRSFVKRAFQFMNQEHYLQLDLLLGENRVYDMTSIGFIIAPKINSFGRLPHFIHPNHLVKYFLKNCDRDFILKMSNAAMRINNDRRNLTNKQYKNVLKNNEDAPFLYVYDQDIQEGIVGFVAGKYTSQYRKPSFVMTYDQVRQCYRGSARSIKELPLNKILNTLSDDLLQYGGHALAGGFSVAKEDVTQFKEDIARYIEKYGQDIEERKEALEVSLDDISLSAVKQLSILEPQGQGNEETTFMLKHVPVSQTRLLGQGQHLRFDLQLPHCNMQALYFHCPCIDEFKNKKEVQIYGKLKINKYLNTESINMILEDIK